MTQAAGAAAGFSLGETELLLPGGPRDLAALYSARLRRRGAGGAGRTSIRRR